MPVLYNMNQIGWILLFISFLSASAQNVPVSYWSGNKDSRITPSSSHLNENTHVIYDGNVANTYWHSGFSTYSSITYGPLNGINYWTGISCTQEMVLTKITSGNAKCADLRVLGSNSGLGTSGTRLGSFPDGPSQLGQVVGSGGQPLTTTTAYRFFTLWCLNVGSPIGDGNFRVWELRWDLEIRPPLCAPGTSSTTTREPCTPCGANFFSASSGASTCTPCLTCTAGTNYETTACSATTNRVCTACSTCALGTYQTIACAGTQDRSCTTCSTCAFGSYETTACTATSNRDCTACQTCGIGVYETTACTATSNRGCTACQTCAANTYEFAACGGTQNRVCTACSTCADGTYQTTACFGTQDRICSHCSTCTAGTTYETTACTSTSNRFCTTCSTCAAGYRKTSDCTLTANTTCAACTGSTYSLGGSSTVCSDCTVCPAGSRASPACTTSNNANCVTCTQGTYSTTSGLTICTNCPGGRSYTGATQVSACFGNEIIDGFAGYGSFTNDGISAYDAMVVEPLGMAISPVTGDIYWSERQTKIRSASASTGLISTLPASSITYATHLAFSASGDLYIVDAALRKIFMSTGGESVPVSIQSLTISPNGIAVNAQGEILLCSSSNHVVYKIVNGVETIFAGNFGAPGYGGDGGPATDASATLTSPSYVSVGANGNTYILCSNGIRVVFPNGNIDYIDGYPSSSNAPGGITVGPADGDLYVSRGSIIWRYNPVTKAGIIFAGVNTGTSLSGDGFSALTAEMGSSRGIAMSSGSILYVTDTTNNRIRGIGVPPICTAGSYRMRLWCAKCPDLTYSDTSGATSCSGCSTCPAGSGVISPCNSTSNTVCGGCPDNFFSTGETAGACTACKTCGAMEIVVSQCTPSMDTICTPASSSSSSSSSSSLFPIFKLIFWGVSAFLIPIITDL